jgi:hypothetical protein
MNRIVAKMIINLNPYHRGLHERRDDEHGSELQGGVSNFLSKVGQVVFVGSSDFFNQAMHSETLEHSGDLGAGFCGQDGAQGTVLESPDVKFSPEDPFEQLQILTVKQIKPTIGPPAIRCRLRDLFKVLDPHGGIFNGGDEFQVTSVRRFHQFPKDGKAVNGFLQRGIFHFPSTVPMFHFPVVFEKTDVIDRCLNAQNDPQFVIHFNRNRAHMMFNSSPFDSGVEIIADLSLIGPVELSSQEGRDLLGFDGVDRRTGYRFIEGTEIALVFENHIRSKLDLHQCPMITRGEMSDHRTERFRYLIQAPMKKFYLEVIGELLSFLEILRLDKGILQKTVGETFPLEKAGQVTVSVKIELQAEGSPGRHPQIAQPQIFQDKVKIVVDALGLRASKKRPATLFVMPGFERRTGLHGREDMEQPRMIPTVGDDLLQTFFLPEILLSNKFDLQTILLGQLLRMETDFVPQGFDKLGIIENANALGSQMATHGIGIADIGKRPGDDYPIKTRKDSSNFTGISFCQRSHGSNLLRDAQKDSLCL